jgi:hypothetical protein
MKKLFLSMILSVLLMLVIFTACSKQVFDGSCTGNDEQFVVDYSVLNCTKTHEIKLEKGATINVIVESKSGRVDILVVDENGEEIYKGDNASSGKFLIDILKTGLYKFSVTGSNAKGSVNFRVAN